MSQRYHFVVLVKFAKDVACMRVHACRPRRDRIVYVCVCVCVCQRGMLEKKLVVLDIAG